MPTSLFDFITLFLNAIAIPTITSAFFVRTQKNPRIKKWVCFSIIIASAATATILNSTNLIPRTLSTAIFQIILICMVLFSSKDKLIYKIINFIIYYIIMTIFDLLVYLLTSVVPSLPDFVSLLLFTVLLSLGLYSSEQFIKSFHEKKLDSKSFLILLIPITQMLTLSAFCFLILKLFPSYSGMLNSRDAFAGMVSVVLSVSAVLSLIVDIIAFKQYIKNLDLAQVEAENKSLEYQNELNLNYFNELKENETELRKIKHDIGGCLETMKEIIYTEKNTEKAQYFFDELSQALGNITTGFYCQNSLINAIIMSKAKICDKQSIAFNVDLRIPDEINISDTDLCRILVNILDNAIEANEKTSGNKFINLSIKEIDGYLYLSTKNPFNGEDIRGTSKENKKDHGYGLKILNDFAKKYNGNCQIKTNDNQLSNLLVLQNKR